MGLEKIPPKPDPVLNDIVVVVPRTLHAKPDQLEMIFKRLKVDVQTVVDSTYYIHDVMYIATGYRREGQYIMVIRDGLWALQFEASYGFI